ncbi:MAG: histidinol-phosphatase HisJ family protein [Chloroflexota bacterium]|nr:histidinol-phosphatase HisJ family protein [Chloroflexota bacterium]
MFDYHVHTHFSADCEVPMAASCEAAIAAGVTEIAFTDHVEHEPSDPSFGHFRYDAYRRELEDVRSRYSDSLTILAGAEVDFNTRIADRVEAFLSRHDFDFIIGSVHYGDAGQIIFPEYFEGRSLDDVFLPYYEQVHAAIETRWFDTIGHLDLPKRYAPHSHEPYDPTRYRSSLDAVFEALVSREVSFEINTSGLRQPPRSSMPGPRIVKWYVEAGGTLVTLGSDSHVPETIGAGTVVTCDMLTLCGIESVSSFRQRVRRQVPLESLRRPAA